MSFDESGNNLAKVAATSLLLGVTRSSSDAYVAMHICIIEVVRDVFGNIPIHKFKGTKNGGNRHFSFTSEEKDYSGVRRSRHFTVFTTDYYSNRGLFISVHSVWYIYYIRLFYTAIWDSHFLLTREFSLLVPIKKLSLFPNL